MPPLNHHWLDLGVRLIAVGSANLWSLPPAPKTPAPTAVPAPSLIANVSRSFTPALARAALLRSQALARPFAKPPEDKSN
jgi:hypothetical protein